MCCGEIASVYKEYGKAPNESLLMSYTMPGIMIGFLMF
jgi:hypothetical protein